MGLRTAADQQFGNFNAEIGLERALVVGKDGEKAQEWLTLPNGKFIC